MPGRGRILQLTTYEFFRENFLERAKSVSLASAEQGLALARFGSRAQDCVCDKQGRVQISQKLLDYAGLKDSAMLVGAVDRIQIWDKARWEASQGDDESFFDELEKLSAKPDRLTDALRGAMGLGGDGK
jgi:division/cell wall cluster transcriptional repressor MraZ